jgi:hypothetical protein
MQITSIVSGHRAKRDAFRDSQQRDPCAAQYAHLRRDRVAEPSTLDLETRRSADRARRQLEDENRSAAGARLVGQAAMHGVDELLGDRQTKARG